MLRELLRPRGTSGQLADQWKGTPIEVSAISWPSVRSAASTAPDSAIPLRMISDYLVETDALGPISDGVSKVELANQAGESPMLSDRDDTSRKP